MSSGANVVKSCAMCCCALVFATGAVSLLAFTIKALVDDWYIERDYCDASHMRAYLITILCAGVVLPCILTCLFGASLKGAMANTDAAKRANKRRNAFSVAVTVGFAIWGWVEAFHNSVHILLFALTSLHPPPCAPASLERTPATFVSFNE